MERVDEVVVDRSGGGNERLARHLSAEDPLPLLIGTLATEHVPFDRLEIEDVEEFVDGHLTHSDSLASGNLDAALPVVSTHPTRFGPLVGPTMV